MAEIDNPVAAEAACDPVAKAPPRTITIPILNQQPLLLVIDPGAVIYVVGPNGAGKSALIGSLIAQVERDEFRRITAHRQNWTSGDGPNFASSQRANSEQNVTAFNVAPERRHLDHDPQLFVSLALAHLINAENIYHREYRPALLAAKTSAVDFEKMIGSPPLHELNRLLRRASLTLEIVVGQDDTLRAQIAPGVEIGVSRLSDGERNAVFLCAEVLTAPKNTLLFIDEPERHLHRSIINPLLRALFGARTDCAFIIATHELSLPIDSPSAQVVLLQGSQWSGENVVSFQADLLSEKSELPEEVRASILGSRPTVLFMEGKTNGPDLAIYSLLLDGISAKPIGNCRDVIAAVSQLRNATDLHWVKPFGLIDLDDRDEEEVMKLAARSVFAITTATVEGIYYSNAAMTAVVAGANQMVDQARLKAIGVLASADTMEMMCRRRVVGEARRHLLGSLLTDTNFDDNFTVEVPLGEMLAKENARYQALIGNRDLESLMQRYALKKTSCFQILANTLGFANRKDYEGAVLDAIQENATLKDSLLALLGALPSALASSGVDAKTSGGR